jgi:flagellar hook-associated protein 3 FlgL
MTERITAQMQDSTLLAGINSDLASLDNTQQELSSGYSINEPSDNPYGTSLALALGGQISTLNNYTSNVQDGTAWAQTASSSLQSIEQIGQRVQELVTQSANGTMSQSDLNDAADEISQLLDQVKQEADAQYNGMYIFSGTATSTQPYESGANDAYQGNGGSINRAIGPGSSIQINADLSSVLGSGTAASDGGMLDTMRTIVSDLTSGNTAKLGSDLTSIQGNLNSLEGLQASVGATTDRLQMASSRITSMVTTDSSELSNDEDTDMAAASTQFATEQAAYSAALQSGADIVQQSLLNFLHT